MRVGREAAAEWESWGSERRREDVKTDSAVVQKAVTLRMFLEITRGCPGPREGGGLIRPHPDPAHEGLSVTQFT